MPDRIQEKQLITKRPEEYDAELPSLSEVIIAQSKGIFCEKSCRLAGTPGSACDFQKNEVFVRQASIDGSMQKLMRASLRARLFH